MWSSEKVTKGSYSTLYSLMVNKKGSLPARIVLRAPPKLQPLVYMGMHLLMLLAATLTSVSLQPPQMYYLSTIWACSISLMRRHRKPFHHAPHCMLLMVLGLVVGGSGCST